MHPDTYPQPTYHLTWPQNLPLTPELSLIPEPTLTSSHPENSLSPIEPCFRESEETVSDLSLILDSLIPLNNVIAEATPLPTYLGKKIIDPSGFSEATSSKATTSTTGKNFVWSRGLAHELSPIKTRSNRKKRSQSTVQTIETTTSSPDLGNLRALKALARSK
jgi:hypothetical protein